MTKIFITGDSWGVKEWTPENCNDRAEEIDKAAHRGIHTYFQRYGFEVHNLSSGGSSNGESIDRLIQYIDKETGLLDRSQDYIFWIITDPMRDLRPYRDPKDKLSSEVIANKGWNNLLVKLFHQQCERANNLAKQRDIKIHLIGGITSFTVEDVKQYENLIPLVPSWYDLLLFPPERKMVPKRSIWTSQTSDVHIDDIDLEHVRIAAGNKLSKRVVNEFWNINEFHRIVHNSNGFFKLDNSHPDRHGHKVLFKKLMEYINRGTS